MSARFLSVSERRRIACTLIAAVLLVLAASVFSTSSDFKPRNGNAIRSSSFKGTVGMPQKARRSLYGGAACLPSRRTGKQTLLLRASFGPVARSVV